MEDSLRGQLLVASPKIGDYFWRTVVLVIEHGDEGAMGVVLNRRSEFPVTDAVPSLSHLVEEGDVVHAGGPVEPQAALVIADFADPAEASIVIVDSVGIVDPEHREPDVRRARVYAGHAGWAAGQLDAELEADAWIVAPARSQDAFADGDLWSAVLRRRGGDYTLLATMPEDPSLN